MHPLAQQFCETEVLCLACRSLQLPKPLLWRKRMRYAIKALCLRAHVLMYISSALLGTVWFPCLAGEHLCHYGWMACDLFTADAKYTRN